MLFQVSQLRSISVKRKKGGLDEWINLSWLFTPFLNSHRVFFKHLLKAFKKNYIVDLQCSVNFCCDPAEWPSFTYMYTHTHTHTHTHTYMFFFSYYLFFFQGLHLQHMDTPRLGVKSELQLLACTTTTAMTDLSHICDLHLKSWQCRILNPLSKARDLARILMDITQIHYCWAVTGTP